MAKTTREVELKFTAETQEARTELDRFRDDLQKTANQIRKDMDIRSGSLQQNIEQRAAQAQEKASVDLATIRTQMLERQAELGDEEARRLRERLSLESRQAIERERLVAITKNNLVTEDQQKLAKTELIRLEQIHTREAQRLTDIQQRRLRPAPGAPAVPVADGAIPGDILGGARLLLRAEALKGVISGIGIVMGAIKGDAEALELSVRRLPFGFGEVAGTAIDLWRSLSGSAESAAAMEEAIKRSADAGRSLLNITRELALLNASPEDRGRLQIGQGIANQVEQELAALQEARAKLAEAERLVAAPISAGTGAPGFGPLQQQNAELAQQLRQEVATRLANIDRLREIQRKQEQDESASHNRQAQQMLTQEERAQQQELQQLRQHARELAEVRSSVVILSLEMQGRELDAEITQIRAHYGARIEAAREAGRELLAIELETERSLREQAARNRDAQERESERRAGRIDTLSTARDALQERIDTARQFADAAARRPALESSRFLTGVGDRADPQAKANEFLGHMLTELRNLNNLIKTEQQADRRKPNVNLKVVGAN